MDVSSVNFEVRTATILLYVLLLCIFKTIVCVYMYVCIYCFLIFLSHNMTLRIKF